jgi:hypothetical protein
LLGPLLLVNTPVWMENVKKWYGSLQIGNIHVFAHRESVWINFIRQATWIANLLRIKQNTKQVLGVSCILGCIRRNFHRKFFVNNPVYAPLTESYF